jgi:hypothetical protein
LSWLEFAKNREAGEGPITGGLDVGGPGKDETVLCLRSGTKIILLMAWRVPDARGVVAAALMPFKGRIQKLNVDSAGIGYHMVTHLRDLGFPVTEVNVGWAASDREKYVNLKAELYWALRLRLETGDIAGLKDEKAIAQLASIRYSHNSRGQIVIESKDEAKKRGVKSPDRAEAVMLAFADTGRKADIMFFDIDPRRYTERSRPRMLSRNRGW